MALDDGSARVVVGSALDTEPFVASGVEIGKEGDDETDGTARNEDAGDTEPDVDSVADGDRDGGAGTDAPVDGVCARLFGVAPGWACVGDTAAGVGVGVGVMFLELPPATDVEAGRVAAVGGVVVRVVDVSDGPVGLDAAAGVTDDWDGFDVDPVASAVGAGVAVAAPVVPVGDAVA